MIVLGSTSKYRAELLSRLHLPFTVASPVCDETVIPGEAPAALASRLAQTKALSVQETQQKQNSNTNANAIIIGSDQVASLANQVLGKPSTAANAQQQLRAMRGQSVIFYTALSVLDMASGRCLNEIDKTIATVRDLTDDEIDRYIAVDNPLDCAGSFKVEKLGISLFDRVESIDPTALIGLPLIKLSHCLRAFGVAVP